MSTYPDWITRHASAITLKWESVKRYWQNFDPCCFSLFIFQDNEHKKCGWQFVLIKQNIV